MTRRLLSMFCALALCLSLLPGTALAAAPAHLALGDSITTGYAPGGATVDSPFADQVAADPALAKSVEGRDRYDFQKPNTRSKAYKAALACL